MTATSKREAQRSPASMRVLIIQPWIRHAGGAELISVHLANELLEAGHTAPIACTFVDLAGMPDQAHAVEYLIPPRWLSRLCQRSRLFFLLVGPWLLLALVWKHSRGIDVLNPHNFPASWVAALVGAVRRIPVLWTCNEVPERLHWRRALTVGLGDYLGWWVASRWIDRALVRLVDAIHVLSDQVKEEVGERYGRLPTVVHPGIDAEFFGGGSSRKPTAKYGLEGKFVLLCVGKLHPRKNQALCIEVLRRVLPEIPDALLVLVGDGPMKEAWRAHAEVCGVSEKVLFVPQASSEELRDLYAACSVNLLAATNESWGLPPFEALSGGRISVVSDDSGAADVLSREGIGVVCEATAETFAQHIRQVFERPAVYAEMAARGRTYVSQQLTWAHYTERVLGLMKGVRESSRKTTPEEAPVEEATS